MIHVIMGLKGSGKTKKLVGTKGEYEARTVIIATGAHPRPIAMSSALSTARS